MPDGGRKAKRAKTSGHAALRIHHPLGVQPSGNAFFTGHTNARRRDGLGALAALEDSLLVALLGLLDAASLARLSGASKTLYAFARLDELWAELTLHEFKGQFTYTRSWWYTYVKHKAPGRAEGLGEGAPFELGDFYSDVLFQPHYVASVELDPAWLEVETIDRRAALSLHDFVEQYEKPNRPVILTDVVTKWPAFSGPPDIRWTRENLLRRFGEARFDVSGYQMRLADYMAYADGTRDDQPIYLFDKAFAKKAPEMAGEYSVPEYFGAGRDLFSALGEEARPDYRWLIVGPARSGSVFHKDPNETCAWNALVSGRKKWILYPPHMVPPGVHPSHDGGEVTQPVALIEWFLNFYKPSGGARGGEGPLEGVCGPGDLIFVPRGWWHCVLNVEESVAITQNYVSATNLPAVLRFLRDKPDQVSGTAQKRALYPAFRAALAEKEPELLAGVEEREKARGAKNRSRALWSEVASAAIAAACPWGSPVGGGMGGCGGCEEAEEAAPAPALTEFRFNFA
eukprot:tig00000144_g9101.t1